MNDSFQSKIYNFDFSKVNFNEKERTLELLASEEIEIKKWKDAKEIVLHNKKSCDLSRIENGAVPFLLNHDWKKTIGRVTQGKIENKKLFLTVKMSKNADDILEDIKDGIRIGVSIGFAVNEVNFNEDTKVLEIIRWELLEISSVAVPQIPTAGIGKKSLKEDENYRKFFLNRGEKKIMATITEEKNSIKLALQKERERIKVIKELATKRNSRKYNIDEFVEKHIEKGTEKEEFNNKLNEYFLYLIEKEDNESLDINELELNSLSAIHEQEKNKSSQFSLAKAVKYLFNPSPENAKLAKNELDISENFKKKKGGGTQYGLTIPSEIFYSSILNTESGKTLIQKETSNNVIEFLQGKSAVFNKATLMTGLVGEIRIPVEESELDATWVGESESGTDSSIQFGEITLKPKTIKAQTKISREMLLSSNNSLEQFLKNRLLKKIAQGIDISCLYGTGNKQPKGILNSGISKEEVDFQNLKNKDFLDLQASLDSANAFSETTMFLTHPKVKANLRNIVKNENSAETIWNDEEKICGSNAVSNERINENHIFFGNFEDIYIGMWDTITLKAEEDFENEDLKIKVLQSIDIAVARKKSFAVLEHAS